MADIDNLSIRISASTAVAVKNIDRLTTALSNLNAQLNAIDTSRLERATGAVNGLNNATSGLRSAGRAVQNFAAGMANVGQTGAGVTRTANATENLNNAVNSAAQGVNEAANAARNLGNNSEQSANGVQQVANAAQNVARNTSRSSTNVRTFARSTREASRHASVFAKELTRVGKMLKLMITRMVLRKVIQGVIDGFKNLAQYSSTFNGTLSLLWNDFRQLGNSIAAAVSPLMNALAPALHYIIQLVIKAIDVINQLVSALFGLTSFTKAKTLTDDYAKSLDKSNKSAKALKKTVLGFDELNQLHDNNSGGGGGTSPKDMFEEVPINPKILDFIDNLKKKVGELKKYWDAFVTGFKKGLGNDWKDKVALIQDGVMRIQKALGDIWNDPKVSEAREKYFLSLSEMLGAIAGTYARIGLNIGVNLAQGIAGALEEKTPEVKEYLIEMFNIGTDVNKQIEDTALAIGRISDVLAGDNAIAATKGFTEVFMESFMLISENAARLGSDLVTLITQPIIDNEANISQALDGMFGVLASFSDAVQNMIKDIRETLSDVWDKHLHPMFEYITVGLSEVLSCVLDVWNGGIQPALQELMDMLKPLWTTYIKPLVDDVMHILGLIGNLVTTLFLSVIIPAIRGFVDTWIPRIKDALSILVSIIKLVFQTASLIIQQITFLLRSFLQFFETAFTEGWGAACEELSESWAKQWDSMYEKLKGIVNSILEIIEKMINAIVHAVNSVIDKVTDIPDIQLPSILGGGTFTVSGLKNLRLHEVSLGFANGGFPEEDGWFRASHGEIMGRFDNGQSVVASNEQITNGIAQAVFNAITSANGMGGNNVPVYTTIQIGEEQIARAVTKGQKRLDRRYSPT